MIKIPVLTYESISDVLKNIDVVAKNFKESSIVCIRGIHATKAEQLEITKSLGDIFGWAPNSKSDFHQEYTENHSRNPSVAASAGDEVILNWHLEHPDYDKYAPLVAGVWNMQKFTCSPDVGMTYFMDTRDVYEGLFSEVEKSFLRKAEATWVEPYSEGKEFTNTAKVITRHWLDDREQIRLEMLYSVNLFKFDGQDPTADQEAFFQELVSRFITEVNTNTDLRIVQNWQEGDIVVPDLYAMAHAVTGGFSPEEREFTGYWCYFGVEEAIKNGVFHPSWDFS